MFMVAAILDLFKGQLQFNDVMAMELPLLSDIQKGRETYLNEKHIAEKKELERIQSQAKVPKK